MKYTAKQKVRDKKDGKVYDFGYYGQNGHLICYEEGECNGQDAYAFDPSRIEPVLSDALDIAKWRVQKHFRLCETVDESNHKDSPYFVWGKLFGPPDTREGAYRCFDERLFHDDLLLVLNDNSNKLDAIKTLIDRIIKRNQGGFIGDCDDIRTIRDILK